MTHAHFDHYGSLNQFLNVYPSGCIYMTHHTHMLIEMDVLINHIPNNSIQYIDTNHPLTLAHDIEVCFYHSGHIEGGISVSIKHENKHTMITSDFTFEQQKHITPNNFPKELDVDILLIETKLAKRDDIFIHNNIKEIMFQKLIYHLDHQKEPCIVLCSSGGLDQYVIDIIKETLGKEVVDLSTPSRALLPLSNDVVLYSSEGLFNRQSTSYKHLSEILSKSKQELYVIKTSYIRSDIILKHHKLCLIDLTFKKHMHIKALNQFIASIKHKYIMEV